MPQSILVVEDDESIREMLRYYFKSVGYEVRSYESGEAMFQGEEGQGCPVLCILDIMLPGMDGLEILRRLRTDRDRSKVPVILLTARTAEMDRVAGLEAGADDYVVKPFGIMELQARVKAVLRRTQREGESRLIRYEDLEIDPAARVVRRAGTVVELTFKEFELLKLLASHRGVALTRDEILQSVWDYDYTGETRTVDMHVKTLRQKLGEEYITTVRGVGYKMS
ncbi:response regulator transcription factor [Pseudoflavonifractor phocaeensis]|uniref:response regulator transcription factor n=1 Tax=Pseudoflavonifractor phocaeensis TaxID=1870988 RepID=UPI0021095210|nr:response regulator transcription factor [Pseudoflavonifractor phocaeensis]MCQ4864159.1 response regulator transcription factor [Pseudoflavonifractor phocaeensis]